MVRRGEYLERAVVVPGGAAPIEALFHRGAREPPLLVAPPHPAAGSMESPLVAELGWAVTRAGHPTLRLNYPGVGASGGSFDVAAALDALRLGADHLALSAGGATSLALAGIGFGAELAAVLAAERARAGRATPLLVLVVPGPELALEGLAADTEVLAILPEHDALAGRAAAVRRRVEARPGGRVAVIPGADPTFVRGLVELGRVVAEALAPPGLVDLR